MDLAMSSESVRSHKDLDVWKVSMDLAERCYVATKAFPANERFGLTAQIRRAAVSIPSNIAEGYGRESASSFIQFLRVAQGSQKELDTQLLLSVRVGLLDTDQSKRVVETCDRVGKMLRNLVRALQAKQQQ